MQQKILLASFVALVGGVGRNRRLDQGLRFRLTLTVLRFVDIRNLICCDIKELYLLIRRILFSYKLAKEKQFNIFVPLLLGCYDVLLLSFVVGG